jgi:hypothetical protein
MNIGEAKSFNVPPEQAFGHLDRENIHVYTHSNPNAIQIETWTQWDIDLQEFVYQGVDMTDVHTIGLGFGDRNNPQPGGSGKIYFDDIRLRK